MLRRLVACLGLAGAVSAYAAGTALAGAHELQTVSHVDLTHYVGKWYEVAKYPVGFEKGLVGVTATYSLRPDGKIKVLNAGRKGTMAGKLKTATGKAWVTDKVTNSKLKVQFFWPIRGNYWIIALGQDYDYAVIGDPGHKYLWILSRTPKMDAKLYAELLTQIEAYGYDTRRIELTPQE